MGKKGHEAQLSLHTGIFSAWFLLSKQNKAKAKHKHNAGQISLKVQIVNMFDPNTLLIELYSISKQNQTYHSLPSMLHFVSLEEVGSEIIHGRDQASTQLALKGSSERTVKDLVIAWDCWGWKISNLIRMIFWCPSLFRSCLCPGEKDESTLAIKHSFCDFCVPSPC